VISSDEEEVPVSRTKRRSEGSEGSEDEEDEEEDGSEYNSLDDFIEYDDDPRTQPKTPKTPKRSSRRDTLPSLTPAQQKAQKRDFNAKKVALSENFIRQLDQELTNNAVEAYYAPHGGIKVQWSSRLRTTAGRAKLVKGTIELSEKVITDEHRLYNVVAHEFCHLAVWSISNERHEHHGSEFKRWGAKAMAAFPEHDLAVTRCHNYKIEYKFQFDCVTNMCTYTWQQHSKPKDLERKRCPWCKIGILIQTRPTPRGVGKGPTEYQNFTKENMSRIKQQNPGVSHKEIMGILGEEWKRHKAQTPMKTQGRRISIIELDADETIIDDMIGEMKVCMKPIR
jgi:predicted SprT family Zn-dependent metalloprotease